MKLQSVSKLHKTNMATPKKFDKDVVSANCDAIAIFPIYGQSGLIWKPNSQRLVCKTYIFINSNLLSFKNRKQN